MLFCSSWFVHSSIWRSCFLLRVVVLIVLDLTYIRRRRRRRRLVKNVSILLWNFSFIWTSLCVFRYFKCVCGWSFPDSVEKTRHELALFSGYTWAQANRFFLSRECCCYSPPPPPPPPPHCPIPAHLPSVHHALLYPGQGPLMYPGPPQLGSWKQCFQNSLMAVGSPWILDSALFHHRTNS